MSNSTDAVVGVARNASAHVFRSAAPLREGGTHATGMAVSSEGGLGLPQQPCRDPLLRTRT